MKKAWSIISSVLVALVVLLAIALVGVRLFGLQVYTVLSGSMEPTYHTGSLIYVKRVDPFTITPGQPITFLLDEDTVATHRVTEVVPDGLRGQWAGGGPGGGRRHRRGRWLRRAVCEGRAERAPAL